MKKILAIVAFVSLANAAFAQGFVTISNSIRSASSGQIETLIRLIRYALIQLSMIGGIQLFAFSAISNNKFRVIWLGAKGLASLVDTMVKNVLLNLAPRQLSFAFGQNINAQPNF